MSNYIVDFKSGGVQGIPGKTSIVLAQGTTNASSTSLVLTGKAVPNYGEIQQENFVRLLENFAANVAPQNATVGQLWYDSSAGALKVYSINEQWTALGGIISSSTEPTSSTEGTLWYNSDEKILYLKTAPLSVTDSDIGPRYFGAEFERPWAQVFPNVTEGAGLAEYNSIARRINSIVGAPRPMSAVESQVSGWGQTDLLPLFVNYNSTASLSITANTLNTGSLDMFYDFDQLAPLSFPSFVANVNILFTSDNNFNVQGAGTGNPVGLNYSPGMVISFNGWEVTLTGIPRSGDAFVVRGILQNTQFNNVAWITLLSRLLKAIRHTTVASTQLPRTGFIKDGRGPSSASLAYSPLEVFSRDWSGGGIIALMSNWTHLLGTLDALEANRFSLDLTKAVAADNLFTSSTTGTWATTRVLDVTSTWTNNSRARQFFNAGGQIKISANTASQGAGVSAEWWNLLQSNTIHTDGLVLSHKSLTAGYNGLQRSSIGFYDLTSTFQTMFTITRAGAFGAGEFKVEGKYDEAFARITIRLTFAQDAGGPIPQATVIAGSRRPAVSFGGQPQMDSPQPINPVVAATGTFLTAAAGS